MQLAHLSGAFLLLFQLMMVEIVVCLRHTIDLVNFRLHEHFWLTSKYFTGM